MPLATSRPKARTPAKRVVKPIRSNPWDQVEEACSKLSDRYLDALANRKKRPSQPREWV
jgi:hypothetical protein